MQTQEVQGMLDATDTRRVRLLIQCSHSAMARLHVLDAKPTTPSAPWKAQEVRQDHLPQGVNSSYPPSIVKITNRSYYSYVQMLARQHTQLIAGLQELYRRTQTGEGWVGPLPDPVNYGQPLTHKILEALGVLQQDEWDDNDDIDGSAWQSFEQQAHDVASRYPSTAASPETQSTFSQVSAPIGAFPNSTIMAKRRSSDQGDPMSAVSQTIQMPPRLATTFPPFDKNILPCTTADAEFSMPALKGPFDLDDANIEFNSQGRMLNTDMDWVFGTDDMFDNPAGQGIPLQVGVS